MTYLALADATAWNIVGLILFGALPAVLGLEILRYIFLEHRRDRIPILLYHRLVSWSAVREGRIPDDEMIWVSYDTRFAEQMQYLKDAGFTTLDMDDYLAIRAKKMPRPAKPVIVTFDDGYLSVFTLAFPVLRSHGQKATFFVVPQPDPRDREVFKGLDDFLVPAQMREMADAGMSIQSHTVTHCVLNELDDEHAWFELTESRKQIAEITGRPVDHIAIPCAGYSRRIQRMVSRAGYRTACCNNKGTANAWSNPLALPRIVIERDMTVADFTRCLSPQGAVMLRITGNLKRLPERLGGARFAIWMRNLLYRGPWGALFVTRNLKKVIAALALVYAACGLLFWWYLLA
jgi:peptidoglycan/xylan/chitin deacetylase (PgdA/CDA1 family)